MENNINLTHTSAGNGFRVRYETWNSKHIVYVELDGNVRRLLFPDGVTAKAFVNGLAPYQAVRKF